MNKKGLAGRLLEKAVRFKFNYIQPRTRVDMNGITKVFWTTTPELYSRVHRLGGEKTILTKFLSELRTGDVVWDIGAFIGMYSIFASHAVGKSGKVYAFEPEPEAFSLLRRNSDLNRISNLSLNNFALSNEVGHAAIYSSRVKGIAISSLMHESRLHEQGIPVSIYSGDHLISQGGLLGPSVIKLDVEGAEYNILSGMTELLKSSLCRYLLIEVHPKLLPNFGHTVADLQELLASAGYEISENLQRGDEYHWICKPARGVKLS